MGLDVFKGLARGLTADVVGAPVDIATQLMNLGLAGYGYAGNKLGLLKPEQMPELIERPVGGSDWFAGDKRSPLADTGTAEYTAGRLTGNILPALVGLAGKAPPPKMNQVNGLLGGLAGDDPNLWLSHGSPGTQLLNPRGELVRELYNPSFAITRDKLSQFGAADTVLVPWPEKLDPKNARTLLTATDSYNPRWSASKAGRIDNLPWNIDLSKGLANSDLRDFVNQRLFEKLGNPYPKQGIKQEGTVDAPRAALPRYMQGLASSQGRWNPVETSSDFFSHRILQSPRFQSLESFTTSPYGGQLIGDQSGSTTLYKAEGATSRLLDTLRFPDQNGNPSRLTESGLFGRYQSVPNLLKAIASDTHPDELLSRNKQTSILDRLLAVDPNTGNPRPMTFDERRQVQQTAGKILSSMKRAPSDYAELKAYGPYQLSQDNIAGIVGRSGAPESQLIAAAKKRGIPYEPVENTADEVEAAKWFLDRKGKTSILTRGLASPKVTEIPAPSKEPFLGDHWIDEKLNKASFEAGNFDYIPQPQLTKLKDFALNGGHDVLNKALNKYKAVYEAYGLGGQHDNALLKVLKELEAAKNTGKPVINFPKTGIADIDAAFEQIAKEKAAAANPHVNADLATPYKSTIDGYYDVGLGGYFSMGQIEAAHPELTHEQVAALADYSWAKTKSYKPGDGAKTAEEAWAYFLSLLGK